MIYVRLFYLCPILGVLRWYVLYFSTILSSFLCTVWGCVLTSHAAAQLSQHHWPKRPFFSSLYILASSKTDWRYIGLFLGPLFCSIDLLCLFFVPIPYYFDYYSFVVVSKVWEGFVSSFFFCLKTVLVVWGLLWFHTNFSIWCISVKKKCHGYFYRDCNKSLDYFELWPF